MPSSTVVLFEGIHMADFSETMEVLPFHTFWETVYKLVSVVPLLSTSFLHVFRVS